MISVGLKGLSLRENHVSIDIIKTGDVKDVQ